MISIIVLTKITPKSSCLISIKILKSAFQLTETQGLNSAVQIAVDYPYQNRITVIE